MSAHRPGGDKRVCRYSAVIFDAGGTLLHMPRPREAILRDLCAEMGLAITAEQSVRACLASERYYVRHYLDYSGDQGEFWRRYHGEALRDLGIPDPTGERADRLSHGFGLAGVWQPYPEAAEVCRGLKALGIRLGVLSNGPATVKDLLSQAGLLAFFDAVLASQSVGIEKPDPRIFRLMLERLGIAAEEALFVGDLYEIDVLGARGAGLEAVLIDREGASSAADCPTIRDLHGLLPFVSLA